MRDEGAEGGIEESGWALAEQQQIIAADIQADTEIQSVEGKGRKAADDEDAQSGSFTSAVLPHARSGLNC